MGQEIDSDTFSPHDFSTFTQNLNNETSLLSDCFNKDFFSNKGPVGGYEIEAILVNAAGLPNPINQSFLNRLNDPMVVHELAAFNVELNSTPVVLKNNALSQMQNNLQLTWNACRHIAQDLSAELMMIGILPDIQENQLTLANMSQLNRYKALNEQIFRLRNGKPINLDISGKESLKTTHYDVMLESACTSFQLHLQVAIENAADFYNASIMLSAPIIAATANSPYLFGLQLWDETRIPLFEQSIELGNKDYRRVTFGSSYAQQSLMECFDENLAHYPILVPLKKQDEHTHLSHLRFHNGTIWRWNRPLIGFDENQKPHLRIEHRVIPAGPSVIDSIANAAFYFGLAHALVDDVEKFREELPFHTAKQNFYDCARNGLNSRLYWPGQGETSVRNLLLDELIPAARRGLGKINIDPDDIDKYISIIHDRVENQQNGANWQRRWIHKHGKDMQGLSLDYLEQQNSGLPVHKWTI
ncbi:MAG: glutamate--cysteine ligase [Proteobacteria bacterium]|nr:glutamate--cysteine ligase [Pseudomonadota bacterium]NOG61174.1 glutamate--cysteine ligase [Pseudomonadota bacterium]